MDSNQPTANPAPVYTPASRGMFGTGIPSTVAFLVASLLFFMPFIDIKCNTISLQTVSGFQLATGFKMKNNSSTSLFDDAKTDKVDKTITKTTTNTDKKNPNLYAMVALGLGVLGLLLSFTKIKAAIAIAMIAGIGGAAAMIGLMLDIKKKVKLDVPGMDGKTGDNDIGKNVDSITKDVSDKINISVDFTPWFWVAIAASLVAAFFCFKRMQSNTLK
jgi:multidrug transporter EmrE-like cation transporter